MSEAFLREFGQLTTGFRRMQEGARIRLPALAATLLVSVVAKS